MNVRRYLVALALPVGAAMITATLAASAPTPAPHGKHAAKHRTHPRRAASNTESEAARREREQRDDLERRVERLEQRYEMQQPSTPPPDAAAPSDR